MQPWISGDMLSVNLIGEVFRLMFFFMPRYSKVLEQVLRYFNQKEGHPFFGSILFDQELLTVTLSVFLITLEMPFFKLCKSFFIFADVIVVG